MGINEPVKEFYIKTIPGMNNQVEDLDLQDRWVVKAQNCRFEEEPGAVDKREPVTYFNTTTMGTGGVVGLHRFYTSGGVTKFVAVHGTQAYVGSDASGTFTSIRTGLTDSKRTSFEVYKDLLIAGNGFDNIWVYDGAADNVTWELGACKALGSVVAGSVATGNYVYQVAIGSTSETQHICGAVSNTVAVASGGTASVALSNIPLGPIGTTARTLYRTGSTGAGQFSLLAEIGDNTTTTYADTILTASTGTAIGSVNDDMPVGNMLKIHRERLFISGDPNNTNKIYYANVYLPHYIQQTTNLDYMEISPEDNDVIMGIPIQLGVMLCIKKNTIRKLHITSPQSGADPTTWYADDPIAFTGSPARWSITQSPYGVLFLGWDHWYRFDGANTEPIMDEFDTRDVLPASYADTVGFWHEGIFLAGYTDLEAADQNHDRVMRYNFKRQALSYDTIPGNCFTARTGDDETGELYYGHSSQGYVLKDKNVDILYRLNTKTMASAGTTSGTFVGGTESSPYIEIGSIQSASAIPDNVCIFWDDTETTPGALWTEVSMNDKLVKLNAVAGTTTADAGHTHEISGTLTMSTAQVQDGGDSEGSCTNNNHVHTVTGTSDAVAVMPKHTKYRVFTSASVTATEFPDGSLVMWDQASDPTGWQSQSGNLGYYVAGGSASIGEVYVHSSTHSHPWTTVSQAGGDCIDSGQNNSSDKHAPCSHTHSCSGSMTSVITNDWELDRIEIPLIKKIGEADTWDGSNKYIYSLYSGTAQLDRTVLAPTFTLGMGTLAATGSGSTAALTVTMTGTAGTAFSGTNAYDITVGSGFVEVGDYEDRYVKVSSSALSTGAVNTDDIHDHNIPSGTSDYHTGLGPSYGGYHHQMIERHQHGWSLVAANNASSMAPPYRTFRLLKKNIGHMRDYNAALITSSTAGTWTSPSIQIDALTLDKIYWNESKGASDDVLVHTRTGATKTACEAASWSAGLSDPNGSTVASTANIWFQYKIEFTAADTVTSNPKVFMANGFVLKLVYTRGATSAETAVEFIYQIGFRNFDSPTVDKTIKKLSTVHEGSTGSFTLTWVSDQTTGSFNVDLPSNSGRWDSYAQATAVGKAFDFQVYKNDNNSFRLSEIKGLYSSFPEIL